MTFDHDNVTMTHSKFKERQISCEHTQLPQNHVNMIEWMCDSRLKKVIQLLWNKTWVKPG